MIGDNYYFGDSKVENVHTNNVDVESNRNMAHNNVD